MFNINNLQTSTLKSTKNASSSPKSISKKSSPKIINLTPEEEEKVKSLLF